MSRKNTPVIYSLAVCSLSFIGWGGNTDLEINSPKSSEVFLNQEDNIRNDLLNQIDPEILQICPEIRNLSEYALCCVKLVGSEIIKSVLSSPELVEEFKKLGENSQNKFDEKGFIASIYIIYKSTSKSSDKNEIIDGIDIDATLDHIVEQIIETSS